MLCKVGDEIVYPFPNFNGATIEPYKWITNFTYSFRIWALKIIAVEIYNILDAVCPKYLTPLFSMSITPYNHRDKNKFIQPVKRKIKSLAYYGTHLWNYLMM